MKTHLFLHHISSWQVCAIELVNPIRDASESINRCKEMGSHHFHNPSISSLVTCQF